MPTQHQERPQPSTLHERRWSIVAVICLIIAAFFLWGWQLDAAFVVATLGVLAWFLDVRNRLRGAHIEGDKQMEDERVAEPDEN